jgi:hypothetical protein
MSDIFAVNSTTDLSTSSSTSNQTSVSKQSSTSSMTSSIKSKPLSYASAVSTSPKSPSVSSNDKEVKEEIPAVIKPTFLPIEGVEMTDFDEQYASYHYPVRYNNNISSVPSSSVASFRGNVYDLKSKQQVIASFGYAQSYSWDAENEVGYNVDDESSTEFSGKVVIRPGFEGTIIRRRKGYYSTHKKLQCDRSHWGNSTYFKNMYEETQPPSDDELFGGDKSNMTYVTLVCHPDNILTSSYQQESKLYYLEAQRPTENGIEHILPEDFPLLKEDGKSANITIPSQLSIEEAKDGLSKGTYPFIVISYYSSDMKSVHQKKVYNDQYWETLQWRGNDPNPRHQFYSLLDLIEPEKRADKTITSKEVRDQMVDVHKKFVQCLPQSKQEEAQGFYHDLNNAIGNLASHIINVYHQNKDAQSSGEYYIAELPRYQFILTACTKRASINFKNQNVEAENLWRSQKRKMNTKTFNQLLRSAIIDILWKERGKSLYSLVRAMEKDQAEVQKKE